MYTPTDRLAREPWEVEIAWQAHRSSLRRCACQPPQLLARQAIAIIGASEINISKIGK